MAEFFNLPPELRNNIYELLFTSSSPSLSVLATSRLLHEEAASYYYRNNAIAVDLAKDISSGATIVPPVSDRYLKYLKILTVNVRLGYASPVETVEQMQRLAALANHSNFTTLTLNLTSTTSKIVSNSTDDCILHASHPLTLALQHLLSRGVACSVRVILDGVWFAPGVGDKLLCDFEGSLEVASKSSTERAMQGQVAQDHMRELGLDSDDLDDAKDLERSGSDHGCPSSPSSLRSALSELDTFSPTEYQDGGTGEPQDPAKDYQPESLFDEPLFGSDDLEEMSEDELTEGDDIADEKIEDVDDIDDILGNLADVHSQRVTEMDICYMTNFAPNML